MIKIWHNRGGKPEEAWVIQTELGGQHLASAIACEVASTFAPMEPGWTPAAWVEVDGKLQMLGTVAVIR